jgi:hypothetical protein
MRQCVGGEILQREYEKDSSLIPGFIPLKLELGVVPLKPELGVVPSKLQSGVVL